MLKWTVHKTGGAGSETRSVGPCYSIRRAAAKFSRHRARRSADRQCLNNKENCQEAGQQNEHRPSPRKRDSIYMCLDSLPAALRDVSNYQNLPRTPENQGKVQGRLSSSQPRPSRRRSPCTSCSPHRKEVFGDRLDNQPGLKRSRSVIHLQQTPTHLLGNGPNVGDSGYEFGSPARKKQPCFNMHHQGLGATINQTFSSLSEKSSAGSPEIEYSPCPLRTTQSLVALRQRMTDTFPLLSQGISLDNPLYYALSQSPTPSPVDLINKAIPMVHKKRLSETPTHTKDFMTIFSKQLTLALNESDEIKLTPKRDSLTSCEQASWTPKEKPMTCEVSPLARRLAWLRLNTVEKNRFQDNKHDDFDECQAPMYSDKERCFAHQGTKNKHTNHLDMENLFERTSTICNKQTLRERSKNYLGTDEVVAFNPANNEIQRDCAPRQRACNIVSDSSVQRDCAPRQRACNVVLDSSVINILNTNHDRKQALRAPTNNSSLRSYNLVKCVINGDKMETALKRRGVIFNEQTFTLNTPPTSKPEEERTTTSSCSTSIDLDEPSTLKRQRAVRRRRLRSVSDDNIPLSKKHARRHPISFLTLPKGLPSPFDVDANDSVGETPKNTRSKSVCDLGLGSSRRVTFGTLYDIEYSDSGDNNSPSFLGLTLPKGIPSPPSTDEEVMAGVRPLGSPKSESQIGNKRKSDNVTNASDCSEETWDSHRLHYLKTPRLSENTFDDASFAESSRTKSPSFSKNNDEEDNDDDFSSLASSIVTCSPLRQSRSRRCLSFTSPNKRIRSWKRIMGRGELEVSLHCANNLLVIHVYRGRNLGRPGAEPCNAYVKVCLVPSGADRTFHRTCVRKYSNNPRFDHKFVLELHEEDLERRRALISAWHRDRGRSW